VRLTESSLKCWIKNCTRNLPSWRQEGCSFMEEVKSICTNFHSRREWLGGE
jgi:hypothetical protein